VGLRDTSNEITRLEAQERTRVRRKMGLRPLLKLIDRLIQDLEDLNLQGIDRVPATLRERAELLLDQVPGSGEDDALRVRYRVVPLMDVLYRAQEYIFKWGDRNYRGEGEDGES